MDIRNKVLLFFFFILLITSLWTGNIYILVFFSLITFILLPVNKFWDKTAIALFVFSAFYFVNVVVFNPISSGFNLISYLISPVAFYRFGKSLSIYFYEGKLLEKFIFVVISAYLTSLFILTIKDVAAVGVINPTRQMLVSSSDNNALSATLYGLMASVGLGGISSLFAKKQDFLLRIGFIALSFLSLFVVCHLLNRTGIVIFLFCMIVSFVVSTKMNIKKIIPAVVLLSTIVFVVIQSGIISNEILDAYQQREVSSSSDATSIGGRSDLWEDAVKKLITHPFGWEKVRYAHNLWLDIARVGGWLSLYFFLMATLQWLRSCLKLLRKSVTPCRLLLISINVAMFLASFVEPVIDASMLYFSLLMIIWAFTISMANKQCV